jgi:hypothetical protein
MIVSRSASSLSAAFLAVAVLAGSSLARAGSVIEVYPGPGVDTYKSDLYSVEVYDGTAWVPTYVYKFSRKSVCHWHFGDYPSVHFVTFGTDGPVDVRVTKRTEPITAVEVSPHSRHLPGHLSGGQAIGTVQPHDKLWLTINRDDADPLYVFADEVKPPLPPGATYFGPGVRDIAPAAGNHYRASTGETIYLDGGAWVRGNIDIRGTRNVRIMGPGVLSGDLWTGESVGASALPFQEFADYAMIHGDWFGGDGATLQGITIVDSPGYNVFGGVTDVSEVKILSPWFFSTDGFPGVGHVDHTFVFNGDNALGVGSAGLQGDDATVTHSFAGTTNNSVFAGGYWGYEAHKGYTALVDDVDIKTYNNDDWVTSPSNLLAGAFQTFMDNSDPRSGYSHQTYRNIRVEGDLSVPLLELKNLLYIWAPAGSASAPDPPLGNSFDFVFQNVSLEGTQKYRSEIKGWDANNGFHNVVLDNVTMGGTPVSLANLDQYFDVNAYVWGLAVTADSDYLAGVVPAVASTPGNFGSYFRTAMQAYNPGTTDYTMRLVYHPAGAPGSASDPSKTVTVPAGGVLYYSDLLPALGVPSGLGSLDVFVPTGETRKLAMSFRVYNDAGAAGTSGFNEDLVPFNKVFPSGATLLLTCPPDPSHYRFNVGVRSLADGAALTATLRSSAGTVIKTATKSFPANYFVQTSLDSFLGGATLAGNESLTIQLTAGDAVVYGATVDNTTNDSSAALAQRQ